MTCFYPQDHGLSFFCCALLCFFIAGTILALTHAPKLDWATDKEKAKKLAAAWEDLQGFGDAAVVVLHTEPTKAALYPRNKLLPQPLKDQASVQPG